MRQRIIRHRIRKVAYKVEDALAELDRKGLAYLPGSLTPQFFRNLAYRGLTPRHGLTQRFGVAPGYILLPPERKGSGERLPRYRARRPLFVPYTRPQGGMYGWMITIRDAYGSFEVGFRKLLKRYRVDAIIEVKDGKIVNGYIPSQEAWTDVLNEDVAMTTGGVDARNVFDQFFTGNSQRPDIRFSSGRLGTFSSDTDMIRTMFGRNITDEELVSLAGVAGLSDPEPIVDIEFSSRGRDHIQVSFTVRSKDTNIVRRTLLWNPDTGTHIVNDHFKASPEAPSGIGAKTLYSQALMAKSLGVTKITCNAFRATRSDNSIPEGQQGRIEILEERQSLQNFMKSGADQIEKIRAIHDRDIDLTFNMLIEEIYGDADLESLAGMALQEVYPDHLTFEDYLLGDPAGFLANIVGYAQTAYPDYDEATRELAPVLKMWVDHIKSLEKLRKSISRLVGSDKVIEKSGFHIEGKEKELDPFLAGIFGTASMASSLASWENVERSVSNLSPSSASWEELEEYLEGYKEFSNPYRKLNMLTPTEIVDDMEIPIKNQIRLLTDKIPDVDQNKTPEQLRTELERQYIQRQREDKVDYSGYIVWAKYGYNANLETLFNRKKIPVEDLVVAGIFSPEDDLSALTMHDLMSTPEGQKWWTRNGWAWDAEFDLQDKPDGSVSDSMEFLEYYMRNRAEADLPDWLRNVRKAGADYVPIDAVEEYLIQLTWQQISEARSARKVAQRVGL